MPELTDAQLLRDYAEHRNEAAFRELVSRHADIVYAAALRQVNSPELAQDIAQSVFTDLARKAQPLAGTLTGEAALLGWLFRSTRFVALNQLRDDRRRQTRERHAMENLDPASEAAPAWERVQPVLDEAMAELSDEDREALLLRYFKKRDFRTIGAALGVSDDAAQKRVSRALERLRTQLTSRGVTTTAGALSALLVTNSVTFAPASLAATLSTAALAGTTTAATTTATATKAIAMTTLQKTILTATIAVAVGTGIYEAQRAASLQVQVQALHQQQALLDGELQQLRDEKSSSANRPAVIADKPNGLESSGELLRLRAQVTRLQSEASEAVAAGKEALAFQSEVLQVLSNTPPIRTLVATSTANVPWSDTVVLGGWKTPSGKRAIVLTDVGHADASSTQVLVTSRVLEYTETAAVKLGLSRFNTDEPLPTSQITLTSEQATELLKLAQGSEEVTLTHAPRITTRSGGRAQIQSGEVRSTPSGQQYQTGAVLEVLPTVSPDGKSVQVVMTAQLNYPIPLPTH